MGQVVAVSVAQPSWQEIDGRPVLTSIVRSPSGSPVHFGAGGPDGNATAVHTEEVFAFFSEHYDHWTERLGIDRAAWGACHWGENLLLSGLPDEAALHIGDRLRIGAALLEVTSPRIPCFKLSWRLGQPASFLRTLIDSGRMGCYLRVIEAGRIGPGDAAERESVADDISVSGLSAVLHDPDIADLDRLRDLLATPGLGGQAAGMLRKRLAFLTDGQSTRRGRWPGWRRFEIASIESETKRIKSFRLRPGDGGPVAGYRAGQNLVVRLPGGAIRTWSLSDHDTTAADYRVSIQRGTDGDGSVWMHDTARVGDIVDVRPPSGRFVLDRSGFVRIVLISAGIGVTPLLAMLKAHAERGDEAPPLLWLHVARSGAEHAFAREADALLATIPGAIRRVHYTSPDVTDPPGVGYDRAGRPDAEAIAALLSEPYALSPFGRPIELTGVYSDFYLCGPRAFEHDVRQVLLAHGVEEHAIHSESFGGETRRAAEATLPALAEVVFAAQARTIVWRRDEALTLLEAAEAAGIAVDSACRLGDCGTCEVALREGTVRYTLAPAARPPEGRVLLCCAQPTSTRLVLQLPAR